MKKGKKIDGAFINKIGEFDHAIYKQMRHQPDRKHILIPTLITTTALVLLIYLFEMVNLDLRSNIGYSLVVFTAFAGSAFILFMTPYSRSSSVKRFVKSYAIASVLGEIGYLLTGIIGFYPAAAITLFVVALLLFETDSTHPPAMGIAFAFIIFQIDYAGFLIVVLGVAVFTGIKLVLEKLGINP
ncbi:MAG: HPP family protein [Candidatus Micrarchaeota archaeon]|nr:HPP family protein [Candidatus Micrarchaeota archaeon]